VNGAATVAPQSKSCMPRNKLLWSIKVLLYKHVQAMRLSKCAGLSGEEAYDEDQSNTTDEVSGARHRYAQRIVPAGGCLRRQGAGGIILGEPPPTVKAARSAAQGAAIALDVTCCSVDGQLAVESAQTHFLGHFAYFRSQIR
jgi:hypothetical protein